MNPYFVVQLANVSDLAEAWLSENAFAYGALGISEVLPFEQPEGEEDVYTRIPERRRVDVYFEEAPEKEFLENLGSRFPEVQVDVKSEQSRDWLAEWKKGFKPFPLVGGHVGRSIVVRASARGRSSHSHRSGDGLRDRNA
ncbi:MAG: hypothetical protein HC902_12490 [Calothrix sp. SM1_5_4]|nr:hypothetical protein [Calothrix sp. SM1_5_4]